MRNIPALRAVANKKIQAATPTFGYCHICGHEPEKQTDASNRVLRYWDPNDGWKITSLCPDCAEDALLTEPSPEDYAFPRTNGIADDIDTDEDPLLAL